MIKYVYASRNKKSGQYSDPAYHLFNKEDAVEVWTASAKETPDEMKERVKEVEMYYIGEFDTKTGLIKCVDEPEFIIDLGSVI